MQTLADINVLVAHHVRRDDFDITSTDRLPLTNFVYRRFAALTNWEDFTFISTRMSTSAGVGTYAWAPGRTFQDVQGLFVQDGDNGGEYKRVVPARSILTHYDNLRKAAGFPETYRRYRLEDETLVLELAPAPKWGSKTIKVDGVIEPESFIDSAQRTLFTVSGIDDAFALSLAAFFAARDGAQPRSAQLFGWAADQIRLNTGKEIKPDEIREALLL